MTTAIDYAEFYVSQGWDIFPCKPKDKVPMVKWQDEACSDIEKVKEWFDKYPNANIGLATGARSNVFALDVDTDHGGQDTLKRLVEENGALPNTPKSNTGGGGNHYLFKWPFDIEVRNSAGKLGPGLDTRGNGGYIVVPISVHPSGNLYQWDEEYKPSKTKVAPAPYWLLEKLRTEKQVQSQEHTGTGAFSAGQRNNALTSLAGAMRRRGMTVEAIFLALNAENLNKCVPPLPEDEVMAIAESVSRYAPSAAPKTMQKDRLTAEWSFCRSIYAFPEETKDFYGVQPEMFADGKLAKFWSLVIDHNEVTDAASRAGVLADLEGYRGYEPFRMDEYAKNIQRFYTLSRYLKHAKQLEGAAIDGDDSAIDKAVQELNKIPAQVFHKAVNIFEIADEVERQIEKRAENPTDVWGIPYAHERISKLTGGKQLGELILCAAEPKLGKSWWWLQDTLETGVYQEIPVFYWCGEMKTSQLMRRFYQLLGVNSHNMKTGRMTEYDWQKLREAKALVINSPIFIDDQSLELHELRPLLIKQKEENGIQQFVIDYAMKIRAPGKDNTEKTERITDEVKDICNELDLAGVLIASVTKLGMDTKSLGKMNVRGSGQQIHDADIIYLMTKFDRDHGLDYGLQPRDYEKVISLYIDAGRELDHQIQGGFIPYIREPESPRFKELERIR